MFFLVQYVLSIFYAFLISFRSEISILRSRVTQLDAFIL